MLVNSLKESWGPESQASLQIRSEYPEILHSEMTGSLPQGASSLPPLFTPSLRPFFSTSIPGMAPAALRLTAHISRVMGQQPVVRRRHQRGKRAGRTVFVWGGVIPGASARTHRHAHPPAPSAHPTIRERKARASQRPAVGAPGRGVLVVCALWGRTCGEERQAGNSPQLQVTGFRHLPQEGGNADYY